MRLIVKKTGDDIPALFRQWLAENAAIIQAWIDEDNPPKTGDNLWSELGKTFGAERATTIDPRELKKALEIALFEEQHGLCCYCGNALYDKDGNLTAYHAIEHFKSKNSTKQQTFDYANLLLCCKESKRLSRFEIGRTIRNLPIDSIGAIQQITSLPKETIASFHKNKKIDFLNLKAGEFVHVPNPPHCDDEKSKYDKMPIPPSIINPTVDSVLIELLTFTEDGNVGYEDRDNNSNEVIGKTLIVLGLNCDTLVERRKEKWLRVSEYYSGPDGVLTLWMNEYAVSGRSEAAIKSIVTNNLEKLIKGKSEPNEEDNLLEAFYFVEIAFLKNLLGRS